MTLDEFLERTGLSDRTLRHWHRQGLVPRPTFMGDGGYGDAHVTRVLAIFELQKQGVRRLDELTARLDAMTPDEQQRLVDEDEADEAEHDTQPPMEPPTGPMDAPLAPTGATITSKGAGVVQNYARITLRDGLVLEVRHPIDASTQALVRSIASLCGIDLSFA